LGYVDEGSYGVTGRRFFHKGGDTRTHHLHVYQEGDQDVLRHLVFVDYLNAHPDMAKKYEKLKIDLADKFKRSPSLYTEEKSLFICMVEKMAFEWKETNNT
jgi:GrpB-like predicted nucleotidyltransferase (UPF0157 family)